MRSSTRHACSAPHKTPPLSAVPCARQVQVPAQALVHTARRRFGIAWTVLYICMGLAAYRVYGKVGWPSWALQVRVSEISCRLRKRTKCFSESWSTADSRRSRRSTEGGAGNLCGTSHACLLWVVSVGTCVTDSSIGNLPGADAVPSLELHGCCC